MNVFTRLNLYFLIVWGIFLSFFPSHFNEYEHFCIDFPPSHLICLALGSGRIGFRNWISIGESKWQTLYSHPAPPRQSDIANIPTTLWPNRERINKNWKWPNVRFELRIWKQVVGERFYAKLCKYLISKNGPTKKVTALSPPYGVVRSYLFMSTVFCVSICKRGLAKIEFENWYSIAEK